MLEPLHEPKNRSAYAQPLVAKQPAAQATLASSRDWYRLPPEKSVARFPNGHLTPSSQCDGGGGGEGVTLVAESTGSHCGGTALLSDRRAWALELGADEILVMMALLPAAPGRTRPCAGWKKA